MQCPVVDEVFIEAHIGIRTQNLRASANQGVEAFSEDDIGESLESQKHPVRALILH